MPASGGMCTGACTPGSHPVLGQRACRRAHSGDWGPPCRVHQPGVRDRARAPGRARPGTDARARATASRPATRRAPGAGGRVLRNQACVGGACQGVCAPGDDAVLRATRVQTCDATGTWGTAVGVHQPGVRERRVPGVVHARHDAVLGQRRPDVRRDRRLGHCRGLRQLGVRQRRVPGVVHPRRDAVLVGNGVQTCTVRRERGVARSPVQQLGVRGWRVHRHVLAGPAELQRPAAADVRQRHVSEHGQRVHELHVRRRRLHRRVRLGRDGLHGLQPDRDVRLDRTGSSAPSCTSSTNKTCVAGIVLRRLRPGPDELLGVQPAADVQRDRQVGRRDVVHAEQQDVRERRVHRRVRAGPDQLLRHRTSPRRAARRARGRWAPRARASSKTCVGGSCTGLVRARSDELQRDQPAADVQRDGHVDGGHLVHAEQQDVRERRVHRLLRARSDELLVVEPDPRRAARPARGRWVHRARRAARPASPACARARAAAGRSAAPASNQTETCNATGNWVVGTSCTSMTKTCKAGTCMGTCVVGVAACNGNVPQSCDANGDPVVGTSCTNSTTTCVNGVCSGVCVSGPWGATGANQTGVLQRDGQLGRRYVVHVDEQDLRGRRVHGLVRLGRRSCTAATRRRRATRTAPGAGYRVHQPDLRDRARARARAHRGR